LAMSRFSLLLLRVMMPTASGGNIANARMDRDSATIAAATQGWCGKRCEHRLDWFHIARRIERIRKTSCISLMGLISANASQMIAQILTA
jgi:hypothetical protein